jgi:uncharacterized protein YndB with AHSA1/START domain
MYSWKTSLLLAAPRERVWATLIDFEGLHTWNPNAGPASFETNGPVGQGTRVRLKDGRNGGGTLLTVEEWGPPRLLRLYISQGKTTGSSRYALTNAPNGGTQLEHTLELDPPLLREPLMLFMGFRVKREFSALKRWLEKSS